jgi:L-fucose isomerase-like protein
VPARRRRKRAVRLGLCPIGKFVFSHADAVAQKNQLLGLLRDRGVTFCNLEGVLPDGIVRDQKHVEPVVQHFRRENIDALFIPHCNFGTEGAAGMIAKQCGVPVLLWGPRDDAPRSDGARNRDTLCGTLATSKVLHTLRVPFTYIPNSRIEEAVFMRGLNVFLRAARVAKTLRTLRIGQVGERIDFFWSTIVNEADLLQRFGVQVQPIDLAQLLANLERRVQENADAYDRELRGLESLIDVSVFPDRRTVFYNLALRDRLLELADEHQLDGFSIKTFPSIPQITGGFLSLGVALLNDLGYPVGPESDLHGAISSVLLDAAAASDEPPFLTDVTIRHPSNDNAVLLWHFEAPLSLRHPDSRPKLGRPWILEGSPPGLMHFRLKDGPLTLARFDGDADGYRLGFGEGQTVDGPFTQEFYAWMEVDDWPRWERQLVRGPYIHHCSFVYDHCADVLAEAARFIPELQAEVFGS